MQRSIAKDRPKRRRHADKNKEIEIEISNGAIRRAARRGGIMRISQTAYPVVRECVETYIHQMVCNYMAIAQATQRKIIRSIDVVEGMKRMGYNVYS